ncbi:hypothetical protein CEXT_757501 [Caerostris extrusa]|uniref:Uncharacterized protein n=1 Tax=Caerostris extrusa TaxID=172846 RepID=A0AAV4TC54_CAEEX|nr:hypothetical protein CEXT_757501 [Caerostris extrusa]
MNMHDHEALIRKRSFSPLFYVTKRGHEKDSESFTKKASFNTLLIERTSVTGLKVRSHAISLAFARAFYVGFVPFPHEHVCHEVYQCLPESLSLI